MKIAEYLDQKVPAFRGNALIEALPPILSEQVALNLLTALPEYSNGQREWELDERVMMVGTLENIFVPLPRHVALAQSIDGLIRHGYVGRNDSAHGGSVHELIYQLEKAGRGFSDMPGKTGKSVRSAALVGISGGGKTSTINRTLQYYPQVIRHPDLNIVQVVYITVDMGTAGDSVKGLCVAILHAIDNLVPEAKAYEQYGKSGRASADAMIRNVARLLHDFRVGLLVVEEVQNVANSTKGNQRVMTEIVTLSNSIGVPLLMTGTNKAADLLKTDFRMGRRATGAGLEIWNRLEGPDGEEPDDWSDLLGTIWKYQWTREPVELTQEMSRHIYQLTQGIVDITIKLFMNAQTLAIRSGDERITKQVIDTAYAKTFKLVHPMLEALRRNDVSQLLSFEDIAPISIKKVVSKTVSGSAGLVQQKNAAWEAARALKQHKAGGLRVPAKTQKTQRSSGYLSAVEDGKVDTKKLPIHRL